MRESKRVEAPMSPIALLAISNEILVKMSRSFRGSNSFYAPTASIELLLRLSIKLCK